MWPSVVRNGGGAGLLGLHLFWHLGLCGIVLSVRMTKADQEFIRLLDRLQELYIESAPDIKRFASPSTASWELKLMQQDDYLLAVASGRLSSLHQVLAQFFSMMLIADSMGLEKIFVDCTASEGGIEDAERYELGRKTAEYSESLARTKRLAIVGEAPSVTGYGAIAARYHGLLVETFSKRQAALEWLHRS